MEVLQSTHMDFLEFNENIVRESEMAMGYPLSLIFMGISPENWGSNMVHSGSCISCVLMHLTIFSCLAGSIMMFFFPPSFSGKSLLWHSLICTLLISRFILIVPHPCSFHPRFWHFCWGLARHSHIFVD